MTREKAIGALAVLWDNIYPFHPEEALQMAIAALMEQPRWISVEERLPEWQDGKVLIHTRYGVSVAKRTVNGRWQGHNAIPKLITHWMPLPEPPEVEI